MLENASYTMEVATPPNNNINVFKSDIIKKAIDISNDNKPISEIEMAKIAKFTDNEISLMSIFWKPCFNESWIYLSDHIILTYLTNDKSKSNISDFYKRKLLPSFEEEVDYKQVTIENETVKSWWENLSHNSGLETYSADLLNTITPTNTTSKRIKISNRKKFYIVSGECFKMLLMQSNCDKGKETRKYFIKIEQLARMMKDYIIELNKKQIEDKNKEYNKLYKNHESILKRRKRTSYEKGNAIYVLTNSAFKDLYYKIGKVTQKDDESVAALINRLSTYNTGSPEDYIVHYLCYVDNVDLVESMIKARFEKSFKPANKEWIKDIELVEICNFIRNACDFLKFESKENIVSDELKEVFHPRVEEIKDEIEFIIESDSEDDEPEEDIIEKETMRQTYNFHQIRNICKEMDIIQLGNKDDMIDRIVKYKRDEKINEKKKEIAYIYQYNNKGVFIAKFKQLQDIKIEGIRKRDIEDCLQNKTSKAGNFIWRNKETKFTQKELKEINRKNCMIIIKIDENDNELERYGTIKEASEKNNIGRGVIDRMVARNEIRDGVGYKILNKENKVAKLTECQKKDLLKDYRNGFTITDLSTKYNRVEQYMKTLIKKLESEESK